MLLSIKTAKKPNQKINNKYTKLKTINLTRAAYSLSRQHSD